MKINSTSMKAISPLLAGVLIISFTLAVAAILSGWFTTISKTQTKTLETGLASQVECSKGLLDIVSIDCSTDLVRMAINNLGTIQLTNITYFLKFSNNDTYSNHCGFSLAKGEMKKCLVLTRQASTLKK